MKKSYYLLALLTSMLMFSQTSNAWTLSDNIRIDSKVLNYALQYRVYTPPNMKKTDKLPTIYLADGQWYISSGNMVEILNREIKPGNIKPVIAVFVDNRNPDNLSENRRNHQPTPRCLRSFKIIIKPAKSCRLNYF
jgi:enterochelin esterase-like enzyme